MSSQVLARKYRPQNFESVVGQESIVKVLQNAIQLKRLHHAYLFSGPRGVGKTSLARIFAKALNCEKGPLVNLCDQCVSCLEITEGRSMSVQEIDGASNTSVDDVRQLRENVRYLPPGGRYKIFIIDEVHMLSTAAFNALLKTLEEPPAHALFLLATTDAHKIPATVISRLIRLDLKSITRAQVVTRLESIIQSENLKAEKEALFLVAKEARGGLRDALSLLDQIASLSAGEIKTKDVEQIIGTSSTRVVQSILSALIESNTSKAIESLHDAIDAGVDPKRFILDLMEAVRNLIVYPINPDPSLFDLSPEEMEEVKQKSKGLAWEQLDTMFQILAQGLTDLSRNQDARLYLDVLLVRLAQARDMLLMSDLLKQVQSGEVSSSARTMTPAARPSASAPSAPARPESPRATTPAPTVQPSGPPPAPKVEFKPAAEPKGSGHKKWSDFVAFVAQKKPPFANLIGQGQCLEWNDSEVTVGFAMGMTFNLVSEEDRFQNLLLFLKEFSGQSAMKLVLQKITAAPASQGATQAVSDALSVFGPGAKTRS